MISIVVINWNGKKFLSACLQSLRVQTYQDVETLVIDNASTDGSREYNVLYIDLVAEDSVDEKVVEALRNKFNVASQITGDRLKDWL